MYVAIIIVATASVLNKLGRSGVAVVKSFKSKAVLKCLSSRGFPDATRTLYVHVCTCRLDIESEDTRRFRNPRSLGCSI